MQLMFAVYAFIAYPCYNQLICLAFQIKNFIIGTIADKYLIDTIFLSFEKILVLFLFYYLFFCLNKS